MYYVYNYHYDYHYLRNGLCTRYNIYLPIEVKENVS